MCFTPNQFDLVSFTMSSHERDLMLHYLTGDINQVVNRDSLFDPRVFSEEPSLGCTGQVQHGFAQRFRRDRAGIKPPPRLENGFFSMTQTRLPSLAA
jgi:hypothetical protein